MVVHPAIRGTAFNCYVVLLLVQKYLLHCKNFVLKFDNGYTWLLNCVNFLIINSWFHLWGNVPQKLIFFVHSAQSKKTNLKLLKMKVFLMNDNLNVIICTHISYRPIFETVCTGQFLA